MDNVVLLYWKHFSLPDVSMTISIYNKAMRSNGRDFLTIPINVKAGDEGLHLPIVVQMTYNIVLIRRQEKTVSMCFPGVGLSLHARIS
jgi:hypothetical protein